MNKLNKISLGDMRKKRKSIIGLDLAFIMNLCLSMYSSIYYPYYVGIGLLIICGMLLLLKYKLLEEILNG